MPDSSRRFNDKLFSRLFMLMQLKIFFFILLTVHPALRVKRNQTDAQLILSTFRQPLHVSDIPRSIIRRYNRMYKTLGTYYSFRWLSVVLVGLELVLFTRNSGCGTSRSGSLIGIPLPIDYKLGKAMWYLTRPEMRKNILSNLIRTLFTVLES
jgi:hypothetical protein